MAVFGHSVSFNREFYGSKTLRRRRLRCSGTSNRYRIENNLALIAGAMYFKPFAPVSLRKSRQVVQEEAMQMRLREGTGILRRKVQDDGHRL